MGNKINVFVLNSKYSGKIIIEESLLIELVKRSILINSAVNREDLAHYTIKQDDEYFTKIEIQDASSFKFIATDKEYVEYLKALKLLSQNDDFGNRSNFYCGQVLYFMRRNFINSITIISNKDIIHKEKSNLYSNEFEK